MRLPPRGYHLPPPSGSLRPSRRSFGRLHEASAAVPSHSTPQTKPSRATLAALRRTGNVAHQTGALVQDWSETARAVVKKRAHLITLGLAKRKSPSKKGSAKQEAPRETPSLPRGSDRLAGPGEDFLVSIAEFQASRAILKSFFQKLKPPARF